VKETNMSREQLESWLRETLMELEESLSSEQIVASASLFQDLGLDSLGLERLLDAIEKVTAHRDLSLWYANTAESGDDTLQSLMDFLLGDVAPVRTEILP
jgi:acyl carrier protein